MGKNKDKNKDICRQHLILCEGADATHFIIEYLNYLVENGEERFDSFQVLDFGGNEELPRYLQILPNLKGYRTVRSITIIRDAERDHSKAIQSIRSSLGNNGFSVPMSINEIACAADIDNSTIKVAFTLFPTLSAHPENGTLEDLYTKNLAESADELFEDIDTFISMLQSKGRSILRVHKSRLYTYFSVTNRYTALKLAETAKAGAFRFDCSEMNHLKLLLDEICNCD